MQYLNIVDNDVLYAMTPNEYNRKMKGAMLQDVKRYEDMAVQAIFNANAANGKKVTSKKLFDGDKARKNILNPKKQEKENRDYTYLQRAMASMKKKGE